MTVRPLVARVPLAVLLCTWRLRARAETAQGPPPLAVDVGKADASGHRDLRSIRRSNRAAARVRA